MLYTSLLAFLPLAVAAPVLSPDWVTALVPAATSIPIWKKHSGNYQPHDASVTIDSNNVPAGTFPNSNSKRSTGEVVTGGAAVTSINNNDGIGAGSDTYVETYEGDGSTSDGWPAKSEWVSFVDMFNNNKALMFDSCDEGQTNDSGPEVGDIYNAIEQVAAEANLDHRFILAVIMQESGGCVRVQTTNYGFNNPGLMQSFEGTHSCDNNGVQTNPCPQSEITGMVQDGASGTPTGDGLAALVNQAESQYGASGAQAHYYAARLYNSGSVADDGNLSSPNSVATKCYASDIANRLTGWVQAPHRCYLDD